MGKAARKARGGQVEAKPQEEEVQDEDKEVRQWGSFDKKEKGWFVLKWGYVAFFWYLFWTWAGSHSGQIDDQQVRYYLWWFDQIKTLGGLTVAILTFMESHTLLTGGKKR
eukprot:TRINITY_DN19889_c0_g1_i2.p1 TRINITY_DN19889_c0_g1~~TRINITY_DN19889_c0_g1_i2.p1  ORF type:complete len:110 (-),score=29.85 TRINITY_DN19889_c0_g1_i2:268-597(-)